MDWFFKNSDTTLFLDSSSQIIVIQLPEQNTGVFSNFIYLFTTPFLSEFLIVWTAICYLTICCFANTKWWVPTIVFRLFFWIRFLFYGLITINIIILTTAYWELEYGFFFGNILLNNFATIFIKFIVLCFSASCISKWFIFIFQNKNFWKNINEFAFIFLMCIFFLLCLISLNDLFLILYLIVAVSLALYGLILINIPLFSNAPEAGAKYFLLSVISVGLMFGGIKEIFLFAGHLNLSVVRNKILEKIVNCLSYHELFTIKYALVLLLLGFLFKLAAAPNHFWAPEIYAGLPYELLLFFAVPMKFVFSFICFKIIKSVFFIFAVNDNLNYFAYNEIELFLLLSIVFSMLVGSINALFETNLRKFLAYSSINQIGFLLIGLLGSTSNFFGFAGFVYFNLIYFINLFFFVSFFVNFSQLFYIPYEFIKILFKPRYTNVVTTVFFFEYYLSALSNIYTLKLNFVKDLNKLYNIRHFTGNSTNYYQFFKIFVFTLIIFSLAGIPPLPGFYSKFYMLFNAVQTKHWFIFWVGIFTSILSIFYYLRIIKIMFFEKTYLPFKSFLPFFINDFYDIAFPFWLSQYKNQTNFLLFNTEFVNASVVSFANEKSFSYNSENFKFFLWGALKQEIAFVQKINFNYLENIEQNFFQRFFTIINTFLLDNAILLYYNTTLKNSKNFSDKKPSVYEFFTPYFSFFSPRKPSCAFYIFEWNIGMLCSSLAVFFCTISFFVFDEKLFLVSYNVMQTLFFYDI